MANVKNLEKTGWISLHTDWMGLQD